MARIIGQAAIDACDKTLIGRVFQHGQNIRPLRRQGPQHGLHARFRARIIDGHKARIRSGYNAWHGGENAGPGHVQPAIDRHDHGHGMGRGGRIWPYDIAQCVRQACLLRPRPTDSSIMDRGYGWV